VAGSALIHAMAGVALVVGPAHPRAAPPVYKVQLVAAPAPTDEVRKAPDAVPRPAAEPPAPVPRPKPVPKSAASRAVPPDAPSAVRREAAPRTTSRTTPLPGEQPSTGNDIATISTEGVDFPFPEYLQNIMTQILQRWQHPLHGSPLDAEVSFFIHRDGSITDLQFVKRSGDFGYDLEAQGAVEEAGRFKVFGSLPPGWTSDVLFVRFYFRPVSAR
jgi:outer membrane biosynthesis protein TonB